MKKLITLLLATSLLSLTACKSESQQVKDQQHVQNQQAQYAKVQPVPAYDWSLERDSIIKLYNLRNEKVTTHTVWRSDYGIVEGDCLSMGYGLPYDTSLTNPYQATNTSSTGFYKDALTSIGQAEPNGVFASTNTAATWVMCLNSSGTEIEPVYVESKVTTYPYTVEVNYETNRVKRKVGAKAVTLK